MVLQSVQPYMSAESIDKGTRWASSISGELEGTSVGIVVLTPDNLSAPWIYFESGALAKVVGDARLAPLLCGLKPSDVGTPLSQFQVTVFNKDDVLRLLKSINSCAGDEALPEGRLEKMHNALWGDLHQDVEPIISSIGTKGPSAPKRAEDETSKILEEILVLTRQQAQAILSPEKLISKETIREIIEMSSGYSKNLSEDRGMRGMVRVLHTRWRDLLKYLRNPSNTEDVFKNDRIEELVSRGNEVVSDIMDFVERGRPRGAPKLIWDETPARRFPSPVAPLKVDDKGDAEKK